MANPLPRQDPSAPDDGPSEQPQAAPAAPARTCGCGCGATPKTPRSAFLPGHAARIAIRRPDGQMQPVRERSRCERCGRPVQTLGARFCPGHNPVRVTRGKQWITKRCKLPACGREFQCPPNEAPRRQFHSRTCAETYYRNAYRPRSELGKFVRAQWEARAAETGLSLEAFARQIGLSPSGLKSVLADKRPLQRTMDKLHAAFGDAVPATPTETERRRAATWQARETRWAKPGSPAFKAIARKSAATRKGLQPNPEAIRKGLATKRATGSLERQAEHLRAMRDLPRVRALRALGTRLRWTPSPSREQLYQWADDHAQRRGLTRGAVLAIWKPTLQARGIVSRAGRKPDETSQRRHAIVRELLAQKGLKPRDWKTRRFWNDAAAKVCEAEGADAIHGPGLNRWWVDHLPRCVECGTAPAVAERVGQLAEHRGEAAIRPAHGPQAGVPHTRPAAR